ncbi:MAG TPA: ACT domain-containing protein [Candidatus Saccharimonadales bacterium]|nr:ACT domain-containing protein [Candidatus Saccharimonadales bacterium]
MELFKQHKEEKAEKPASSLFGGLTRSPTEQTIEDIIRKSTFVIHQGAYVYAKAKSRPEKGRHFMISEDDSEITVVTKEENLRFVDVAERNKETYGLIALNPSKPFYSVGFLAAVAHAIASQKMNILLLSTYSKDYVLVKAQDLHVAKEALLRIGLKEVPLH